MSLKTRVEDLADKLDDMDDDLVELHATVGLRNVRLNQLVDEVGDIRRMHNKVASCLHDYHVALGPLWTTQLGHRRPMALLSTSHLEKLLKGNWLRQLPEHTEFAEQELIRRMEAEEAKPKGLWTRFWDHALGRKV